MTEPPQNLILRAVEPDDWRDFVEMRSQPMVQANTLGLPWPSAAEWRKKLENPPPGFFHLGAILDGKLVGSAGAHGEQHPRRAHTAVIGMSVHDAFAGRGVGRALLEALIDRAENWMGYKRLALTVFIDNARAIALYEALGFEREGIERAHALRNGVYVDALAMARVRV